MEPTNTSIDGVEVFEKMQLLDNHTDQIRQNEGNNTELSNADIYAMHSKFESATEKFLGTFLDSKAQCTVIIKIKLKVQIQLLGETNLFSENVKIFPND